MRSTSDRQISTENQTNLSARVTPRYVGLVTRPGMTTPVKERFR
ncbi:hypothetical protein MTO96_044152, partial [Rhipicephalus appendiculatus]